MSDDLKLTIELVPQTSWFDNLRKKTSKSNWDKIRRNAYSDYNQRCGICDDEGRLNCHEIWEYDDENHIQKLTGFIALCNMCHHVKHIGLAGILARQGRLDYEKVVEHFMEINDCDRDVFENHKKLAFEKWRERSKHDWNVDLGEYSKIFD